MFRRFFPVASRRPEPTENICNSQRLPLNVTILINFAEWKSLHARSVGSLRRCAAIFGIIKIFINRDINERYESGYRYTFPLGSSRNAAAVINWSYLLLLIFGFFLFFFPARLASVVYEICYVFCVYIFTTGVHRENIIFLISPLNMLLCYFITLCFSFFRFLHIPTQARVSREMTRSFALVLLLCAVQAAQKVDEISIATQKTAAA